MPIEALRRHAETGSGFDAELWDSLVELGLPGLLVPERFGGAGLGVLDAAVAAEVLGGAAAFAPFAGSIVMATLAFMHGATEELQDAWLPRIAAGEVRFGVGFGTGAATARRSADRARRRRRSMPARRRIFWCISPTATPPWSRRSAWRRRDRCIAASIARGR